MQHFRKLAMLLADLDEWGQNLALGILTRYARVYFAKPEPPQEVVKKVRICLVCVYVCLCVCVCVMKQQLRPTQVVKKKEKKPSKKKKKLRAKGKKGAFYSESEDSDEETDEESEEEEEALTGGGAVLPEDHALLLRVSLVLLRSRNAGVVLAVAAMHQYIGDGNRVTQHKIGRALVRVMRR